MSEHRRVEDLIRRHLGKRVLSYPADAVVSGDYELVVKGLADALTGHFEGELEAAAIRQRRLEIKLVLYRQMISTMLGILDELDTADGWLVIRDSARAELGRSEIHAREEEQ